MMEQIQNQVVATWESPGTDEPGHEETAAKPEFYKPAGLKS